LLAAAPIVVPGDVSSAAFPLVADIHSIPQAVALLGERLLKKWIALVCVAGIGEGKPPELIKIPLLRARFCELLGEKAGMGHEANDLFLLGLLSMMDALLEKPMPEILEDLPVNHEIKDALIGRPGRFRKVFDVVLEYDAGNWEKLAVSAAALGLKEYVIPELHLKAIEWADEVLSETPAAVKQ
jgi:EAL and modified HD-GYP domain-containing signal transduction protein